VARVCVRRARPALAVRGAAAWVSSRAAPRVPPIARPWRPPGAPGSEPKRCRGAGALAAKLAYFDELERIAAQFHAAAAAPEPGRLLPLLQRLDECLTCGARGLVQARAQT